MKKRYLLVLLAFGVSCGGSEGAPPPEYPPVDEPAPVTQAPTAVQAADEPSNPPSPPAPPVHVVAGEHTPIEGRAPTIAIRAPRNSATIRSGDVQVQLTVRNWPLAPDPGNHVHIIVDDEPYIAVRNVTEALNLNALVRDNLHHELAPGTHVLRVFPSRGHHESVKEPGAFAVAVFHYQERTPDFELNARAPMLTYSRPKGCNVAGARVLLDFYLTNVRSLAADGTRVHYVIDEDVTGDITAWTPHYIENFAEGEHTIRLQLVGADGEVLPGRFNDTTRTIRVATRCP